MSARTSIVWLILMPATKAAQLVILMLVMKLAQLKMNLSSVAKGAIQTAVEIGERTHRQQECCTKVLAV
jgi:hypothetical protein